MRILIKSELERNFHEVFKGFDLKLFKALKPPVLNLDVIRFDGCKKGDEVHLEVGLAFLTQKWVSHIIEHGSSENEHYFIDKGHLLPPPLKGWKHTHRIIKLDDNRCVIHDDIRYSTNIKILDILIYPALYFQFWLRRPAYKRFFEKI